MPKPMRADSYDFCNASRIINLLAAIAPGQPVTFEQLQAAIEGINWKDNVRVATTANLNLASPGAAINGITMVSGDRVLVGQQTAQPENGIYIWNGPAAAMTRAPDASTALELESAIVSVDEGAGVTGTTWRQSQVNFTLDTGNVVWTPFGTSAPAASETVAGLAEIATQAEVDAGADASRYVTPEKLNAWAGKAKRFAANIGDNSATQIDVTHNLNTFDVRVEVYRVAAPRDTIDCEVERFDVNTVRLRFAPGLAPTTNQFRAVIQA